MKNQMPPIRSENQDLLYEASEDTMSQDENITEEYTDTLSHTEKPISRGYVATIDYDRLYEDMIFPS